MSQPRKHEEVPPFFLRTLAPDERVAPAAREVLVFEDPPRVLTGRGVACEATDQAGGERRALTYPLDGDAPAGVSEGAKRTVLGVVAAEVRVRAPCAHLPLVPHELGGMMVDLYIY